MLERLTAAMNAHDLEALVACFADDYESTQPAHPGRAFRGAAQVRANWTGVFAGVPDLRAELLSVAAADADEGVGVELGEMRWTGTYTDGTPFAMQGAAVVGVVDDRIAWGRLYMEPVEQGGAGIDEMVRDTYRPPPSSTGS